MEGGGSSTDLRKGKPTETCKMVHFNQALWSIIPVCRKLRQEDYKFEVSLGNAMRSYMMINLHCQLDQIHPEGRPLGVSMGLFPGRVNQGGKRQPEHGCQQHRVQNGQRE